MILHCIDGMTAVCDRIVVVGGAEFDRLRLLVRGLPNTECVENRGWRKGMFTSVKVGLSHVRAGKIFILPADIPLVPVDVYRQLLAVDAEVVIPSFHGRNGHPVCISGAVVPRILHEPDNSALCDVLRAIGFKSVEVEADEILCDIDTPQDLKLVRTRHQGRGKVGREEL